MSIAIICFLGSDVINFETHVFNQAVFVHDQKVKTKKKKNSLRPERFSQAFKRLQIFLSVPVKTIKSYVSKVSKIQVRKLT